MTNEISHEITAEDLNRYRNMGFSGQFGQLREVHENRSVIYQSWQDLIKADSRWGKFLADPEELFSYLVDTGKQRYSNQLIWEAEQNWKKKELKKHLENADWFSMDSPISSKIVAPEFTVNVFGKNSQSLLQIGEVISVSDIDPQIILNLANAHPWGREGGFQMLCNVLGKTLVVKAAENLTLEFLPRL